MGLVVREAWDNQWAMEDRAKTFTFSLYSETDQSVYDYAAGRTATVTITYAGGGALPTAVTDAACTWSTGNSPTYTLALANTANTGQAYRGVLKVAASSVTVAEYPFFFDVVPFPPVITIIDTDLTNREPVLSGSTYKIASATTYQAQIKEAFSLMARDIRNMGVLVTDIGLDPANLREMHIEKSLALICAAHIKSGVPGEDVWLAKATAHEAAYRAALAAFKDIRDRDASGHAESDTETVSPQPLGGWSARG